MVLTLTMKTEENFKQEKHLKFTQLKIVTQEFDVGNFLNIFLKFYGF